MSSLEQFLEKALDAGDRFLAETSATWRVHANRRTVLTAVFAGTTALTLYVTVIQPPTEFPIDSLVTIPQDASLTEAAGILQGADAVRSAVALTLVLRLTGHERDVHAGDYLFGGPKTLFGIARAVSIGAYGLEPARFRIPEGATTRDMAKIFSASLQRFQKERFLERAQPYEGFLFPDTYFFLPNATDELVLSTMRQSFDSHIATIQEEIDAFGKPLKDIVIMASLLEREARITEDRRRIAGVLWNRLNRDMALQVDAAFLYTLGKGSFDLTVADLTSESPYNTYRNRGLPPGAIGSPSLDSLLAAVTPIESDYFYYLADKNYVTHYSKTYEEHLAKKRKYLGS